MDVTDVIPRSDIAARPSSSTAVPVQAGTVAAPSASKATTENFATQVNLASGTTPVANAQSQIIDGAALAATTQLELYASLLSLPSRPIELPKVSTQVTTPVGVASAEGSVTISVEGLPTQDSEATSAEEAGTTPDVGVISILAAISQSLISLPVPNTPVNTTPAAGTPAVTTTEDGSAESATNVDAVTNLQTAQLTHLPPLNLVRSVARSLHEAGKQARSAVPVTEALASTSSTNSTESPSALVAATVAETQLPLDSVTTITESPAKSQISTATVVTTPAVTQTMAADAVDQSAQGQDQPLKAKSPVDVPSAFPKKTDTDKTTRDGVDPASQVATTVPARFHPIADQPAAEPQISTQNSDWLSGAAAIGNGPTLAGTQSVDAPQQPVATISPQEPHRFVEQLGQLVLDAHDRGQQLVAKVSPPDLGTITIEVRTHGSEMVVRMEASSGEAQQLLTDHLPQLHETLNHLGMNTERIDVVRTDTSSVRESGLSANVGDPGTQQSASHQQSEAERQQQREIEIQRQRQREASKPPGTNAFQRLQELNVRV